MKKSTTRITVVVIIMIALVVGYYCYLVNQSRNTLTKQEEKSVVNEVLSRDLDHDYPPTVKEVIKYYNEITKCFYNEECTEEEIEKLARKARELYDEELAANNEMDAYLLRVKGDVAQYKEKKKRIISITLAPSTDVEYYDKDGYSWAHIRCGYNIMENKVNSPVSQMYVLRKDDAGHWKIYGWDLSSKFVES